ncbi:MAG: hypothetical protein ACYDH9_21485 [Limisphaerales bacterium]
MNTATKASIVMLLSSMVLHSQTIVPGVNGPVYALKAYRYQIVNGSQCSPSGLILFVGGNFTQAGNVSVHNVARWDEGVGWSSLGTGVDGTVYTIQTTPGVVSPTPDVYVGGRFTYANGSLLCNNVAKWSTSTSQWSAFN